MYKKRWSEKSLFWNGLFQPRVATAVYHLPIFAGCKDIKSHKLMKNSVCTFFNVH